MQGWNEKKRDGGGGQNKTLFSLSVRILATGEVRTSASCLENVSRKGVDSANCALAMVVRLLNPIHLNAVAAAYSLSFVVSFPPTAPLSTVSMPLMRFWGRFWWRTWRLIETLFIFACEQQVPPAWDTIKHRFQGLSAASLHFTLRIVPSADRTSHFN